MSWISELWCVLFHYLFGFLNLFIHQFIYLFIFLFIHLYLHACICLSMFMMKNGEGVYMYVSITLPTGSTSLHINIISDTILGLRPCKKSDTLNLFPHVRFAVWIRWVWPHCFSVILASKWTYLLLFLHFIICFWHQSKEAVLWRKKTPRKTNFCLLDFFSVTP